MSTVAPPPPRHELQPYKSLDDAELHQRIHDVRETLGSQLLILGHHYQQDQVIELADLRGDSYQLSQLAADNAD
ncbi:MAG: quinolinate synthase NadA, partial [Planctomycetota bacterium]